jgi:hypothetical protein
MVRRNLLIAWTLVGPVLGTTLLSGMAVGQETSSPEGSPAYVPTPASMPTPAAANTPAAEAPSATTTRSFGIAGLDTQAVTVGGMSEPGEPSSEKRWAFRFKGFIRAPMRVGISRSGGRTPKGEPTDELQFHSIPVVPDGNYTRWMFTNASPGPWAELLFQYGNQTVMMTTSIASYSITSGGWRELQAQFGIDRAFITLKFPDAFGYFGGLAWDVGIFSNRYGAMGKYDAGAYETYLIGRTRLAGVTATANLAAGDDVELVFEGGAGAKVDQQYQRYDPTKDTPTPDTYYPPWQPNPGDKVQQGSNVLAHLHAGVVFQNTWTLQGHYIGSFVKDARWNVATSGGAKTYPGVTLVPGYGYVQVAAVDLRFAGDWLGDGYIGYSYVKAKNAGTVSDSIEVLHSQGGWQLAQNYFSDGNGAIHSLAGQYTFSLAAMMMRPRTFLGKAADLTIRPFFMFNKVVGTPSATEDVTKLKWGLDTIYSFMPKMGAGLRFDAVNPKMSNRSNSFYVLSPKLIFRSEFVTHEMIVLQYSYYRYGAAYMDPTLSSKVMPWPFGQYGTLNIGDGADSEGHGLNMKPDEHVVTLAASMWW